MILGSVHDSNYLYIDLKPSNVIVYEDHAYLIDFNACILNGCSKAIMASSSNCAPELLTLEKKGVYCDVYAFGCLVQFVLNKKIHCFLCSKKYRIHTFQHVLKILWLHIFGYKLVIILFCCLSVLYMVACFQERSVFDRYYYGQDVRLFQEAYVSSEDALYRWIESDWIIDEVYRDEESVVFLFKEALKTENTNLIRYIYEHIDPLIIENHEDLLALVLLSLDFDADQVNLCIKSVIDSGFSCKQKLMIVDQCLVGCLENKLVMDLGVVQAWINDLSIGQIESNFESFNDLGVHYLEYLLLLKKEEGLSFDVPDVFIENIDSSSWDDLYGLWRALE